MKNEGSVLNFCYKGFQSLVFAKVVFLAWTGPFLVNLLWLFFQGLEKLHVSWEPVLALLSLSLLSAVGTSCTETPYLNLS